MKTSKLQPGPYASLPASMSNLLHYEICAAWWPQYISWAPLQNIIAAHFARKVERKHRRWVWCLERQKLTASLVEPMRYTGHPYCNKCGTSHWMYGQCPPQLEEVCPNCDNLRYIQDAGFTCCAVCNPNNSFYKGSQPKRKSYEDTRE